MRVDTAPVINQTAGPGAGPVKTSSTRARIAVLLALVLLTASAVTLVALVADRGAHRYGAAGLGAATSGVHKPDAALAPASGTARSFVSRSGRAMFLHGTTFRFTGFNLYNAAASDIYSCPSAVRLDDAELNAAMRQVSEAGGTVVRFWAFQSYTRGGTDYAGVDRVLAAARSHGLKVLPVLENQWSDCSRPRSAPLSAVQAGTWFRAGYRAPLPGQPLSFREYARRITHHYRDNTTIFAWSLMNEAETTRVTSDGVSDLVDFARDMSDVVDHGDPHHLLTLGTQSDGAPGASGVDLTDVYGLPGLDFVEVHDWADRGSDDQAMPGAAPGAASGSLPAPSQCRSTTAPLACSFALARELDKPIVVAEAGIAADDRSSRIVRARQLAAKLDAAFDAGASGYLIWQLNQKNTDTYGVLIGSDDPIYRMLREVRQRWSQNQ